MRIRIILTSFFVSMASCFTLQSQPATNAPAAKWIGWNSWYMYPADFNSTDLTNVLVTAASLGLSNLCPNFVVGIDDGWSLGTNAQGVVTNSMVKFPSASMKPFSDLIHGYGFRSELYYEPRVTSSAGYPQAGIYYLQNMTNAAQEGFDAVKFDHTMSPDGLFTLETGIQMVLDAWRAFTNNSTSRNNFMECVDTDSQGGPSSSGMIGPLTNTWELLQLPNEIDVRVTADWNGKADWRDFMTNVVPYILANDNGVESNSYTAGTGHYVMNNSSWGTNFVAGLESFYAVENVPIVFTAMDSSAGTTAEQLRMITNVQIYRIFFDPAPPGAVIASNANYVSVCKFLSTGERAVTVCPADGTNNHTATITFRQLGLNEGQNVQVQDYWSGTSFYTNGDFSYTAPTNGAVTLLITPPCTLLSHRFNGTNFVCDLLGVSGRNYLIQWSADLRSWNDLLTTSNLTGRMTFTNPVVAKSVRFYRARLLP